MMRELGDQMRIKVCVLLCSGILPRREQVAQSVLPYHDRNATRESGWFLNSLIDVVLRTAVDETYSRLLGE